MILFGSFLISFFILLFQRTTGPTYPVEKNLKIDNKTYTFILPRSANNDKELQITIPKIKNFSAYIKYRKYRYDTEFENRSFTENQDNLIVNISPLPAAGKYEYFIFYYDKDNQRVINVNDEPVIIRFKNKVPKFLVIIHILFVFAGFFTSNIAGLHSIFFAEKLNIIKKFSIITLIFLFAGGFIFGPIMQKIAFNVWWSGFPFGIDLTDNKFLISFLTWLICFFRFSKTQNKNYIILSFCLTILVFLIPHSLIGSEYDFSTNKVVSR